MCNGLWITADIQRAINNKAAKQLLGDSFKRQLKYDGAISAITFICTKADDILTTEVKNSLNIEDEVGDYWEQIEILVQRRDTLALHIDNLKKQKGALEEQLEDLETSFEQWEELLENLSDDERAHRPSEISKKRKRKTSLGPQQETQGSVDDLLMSDDIDGFDLTADTEISEDSQAQKIALTEDEIKDELASIRTKRKEARKSKKSLDKTLSKAEQELTEVATEEAVLQSESRSLCIRGRSQYVKESIKQDFALGIKE